VLLLLLGCAPLPTAAPGDAVAPVDLLSRVDPFIATGGVGYGVGCAYPGPGVPFGLVKVSPDTSDAWGGSQGFYRGGGYHYDDVHIEAFSHMHLHGTGLTDYGSLGVMPLRGAALDGGDATQTERDGRKAVFSHEDEQASPGRYAVRLLETGIEVELTASPHLALHRYAFPADIDDPTVLFDLGHALGAGSTTAGDLRIDRAASGGAPHLTGSLTMDGEMSAPHQVWFAVEVDPPPARVGTWADGLVDPGGTETSGVSVGAWLGFDPRADGAPRTVHLRVALSLVDADGAVANLMAEPADRGRFDWDGAADDARQAWADFLSPVRVWGGTDADQIKLATALFHIGQMPTLLSDADGRHRGFDGLVYDPFPLDDGAGGTRNRGYYSDFSLWDTYRTFHPALTLLWPETHGDLLWSLSRMVEEGGGIPRWPLANGDPGTMLGTPGHVVVAEALLKGLADFGEQALVDHAVAVATGAVEPPYGGRPDVARYHALGFYPADEVGRSVAWTQEVAIADHALVLAAEARPDLGVADADLALLREAAGYWRNLYDAELGWFHARNADGSFQELESESAWLEEYAEGNARQYLWLVPHDPEALFDTLGGEELALGRLEEFMEEAAVEQVEGLPGAPGAWYWHGNEPDIHAPWLFALAGRPDRTRHWVDWVVETLYTTGPDGLDGNDDGGTLSAWLLFADLGFYPLAGTDRYVLGEPRFPRIEIDVDGAADGAPFTILRVGDGEIAGVLLNGQPLDAPELSHADLRAGGSLVFVGADRQADASDWVDAQRRDSGADSG
jgi:predicted alpha-1,2-mannosidase